MPLILITNAQLSFQVSQRRNIRKIASTFLILSVKRVQIFSFFVQSRRATVCQIFFTNGTTAIFALMRLISTNISRKNAMVHSSRTVKRFGRQVHRHTIKSRQSLRAFSAHKSPRNTA